MAATVHKALNAAIRSRMPAPVYYLTGDDDYQKEDALRQLVGAVVDPATRDFNLELRRGGELDARALDGLLSAMPMLAERRLVGVREVGALKKDARAVLDRYLERPAADTVLVLVGAAGARADRGLADRAQAFDFPPLNEERAARWVVHHASAELGASVAPAVAALLVVAVGPDLQQLSAELDKLTSYVAGGREGVAEAGAGGPLVVDEAAVTAVVGVRRGETLADLLDAVLRQDAPAAVGLVPHVLAQPKASAVTVVMALSTQMLAVAWGQARRADGATPGMLATEFFGLLKEQAGAYTGRSWGDAARAWAGAVDLWSAPALDRALALLLDADAALKETRLSSDEQLLTTLVLALCALPGRGARRAA